jgi:hypothetical protein
MPGLSAGAHRSMERWPVAVWPARCTEERSGWLGEDKVVPFLSFLSNSPLSLLLYPWLGFLSSLSLSLPCYVQISKEIEWVCMRD